MNIPSLKVYFSEQERKLILENIDKCLESGQISQGSNVEKFEERFSAYTGIRHSIAVNSGSSSIEIIMRILGVKGKEVLVPTNTFMATATGVLFAGGNVRLADTDPRTFSVSLGELKRRVTKNTAGVIIVHIGGIITPEINEIRKWCDENGLWLFEDAAHAHGSSLNGQYAGSFGIAGSYSFFATKIITCGEGGIIVTNDDKLAEAARLFRNHGKPRAWDTYHTHIGSNYRMSDITAVIALAQLEGLDEKIRMREHIAEIYTKLLKEYLPEVTPILPSDRSSQYKYIVLLPEGTDRDSVKNKMRDTGINLQGEVYAIPLHKQPIAKELGLDGEFKCADDICKRHICLPIYPGLTEKEAEMVVLELKSAMK